MSTSVHSASEKERETQPHATKTESISYLPGNGVDRVTSLRERKLRKRHNSRYSREMVDADTIDNSCNHDQSMQVGIWGGKRGPFMREFFIKGI